MDDRTITADAIKHAIEGFVGGAYDKWHIGITNDEKARIEEHRAEGYTIGTYAWHSWQAESLEDARAIESHYIKMGMKGGTGGDLVLSLMAIGNGVNFQGKRRFGAVSCEKPTFSGVIEIRPLSNSLPQ